MELRQLEYFVAVAEEANFTRAAERVRISQSGVSAQLRQLERELGTELIDRSRREATLTAAGEAVLAHARAALDAAAAVRTSIAEIDGLLRGRLAIGMVVGCTVTPLFEALAEFHRAHPGVELSVREDSSERLVAEVRAGRLDLALIGIAGSPPEGLDSLTLAEEGLVALLPGDHPLAGSGPVTLSELAEHPIVCMPEGTGIRAVFDRSCAVHGIRPTIAVQAGAASAIADLAARGLGAGVLSESMVPRLADRLTARPIADIELPALLVLAWAQKPPRALAELIRRCRLAFGI